jgi:hypothetical protein
MTFLSYGRKVQPQSIAFMITNQVDQLVKTRLHSISGKYQMLSGNVVIVMYLVNEIG